jgi:transcriptional regulator with XRE-family HTH domain
MQRFAARLETEFRSRREKNARYSMRAFAAFLATDHSSLSQILRGQRRVPARQLRSWAKKLKLGVEETEIYVAAESLPAPAAAQRAEDLRQWTAEAISILEGPAHQQILELSRRPDFRPDCRWIAEQIGTTVDAVNLAITRLLRLGLLEMCATGKWKTAAGTDGFRELALERVREKTCPIQ